MPRSLSVDRLLPRAESIDPDRAASPVPDRRRPPGARSRSPTATPRICAPSTATASGISLTQSNALDFGAHLVAGDTGVFLHNRGVGFSLEPGHPAEYGPRRRPTHTLSPALATRPDGSLAQIVGTMGGDVQPQIILQLLARLLHAEGGPGQRHRRRHALAHEAPGAPPFRLWQAPAQSLLMEANAPEGWRQGLEARGHRVRVVGAFNPVDVGCSQIISVETAGDGLLFTGASDPRSPDGIALGC